MPADLPEGAPRHWVKWHARCLDDMDWLSLSMTSRGIMISLLSVMAGTGREGWLDASGRSMTFIAGRLHCTLDELQASVQELERAGILFVTEEFMAFPGWDTYQAEMNSRETGRKGAFTRWHRNGAHKTPRAGCPECVQVQPDTDSTSSRDEDSPPSTEPTIEKYQESVDDDLANQLRHIMDLIWEEPTSQPMTEYMTALRAAKDLDLDSGAGSRMYSEIVIRHAAEKTHESSISDVNFSRLMQVADEIGVDGPEYIVGALLNTAAAMIQSEDHTSYVIGAARKAHAASTSDGSLP